MANLAQADAHRPAKAVQQNSRALRLVGLVLVVLGASGLGTDATLWNQAQPLHFIVLAAGSWLVVRRG